MSTNTANIKLPSFPLALSYPVQCTFSFPLDLETTILGLLSLINVTSYEFWLRHTMPHDADNCGAGHSLVVAIKSTAFKISRTHSRPNTSKCSPPTRSSCCGMRCSEETIRQRGRPRGYLRLAKVLCLSPIFGSRGGRLVSRSLE